MAFTSANFAESWSATTTVQFLRRLTIGSRMNGAYDGDVANNPRVHIQRPKYGDQVTKTTRYQNWEDPVQGEADQITIEIDQYERTAREYFVIDQIENVVRDYIARYQTKMLHDLRVSYEDSLMSYILGLSTGTPGDGVTNGRAGNVLQLAYSAAETGFSHTTGKPVGDDSKQTEARDWVLQFFTDAAVNLFRRDIDVTSSTPMIGSGSSAFWAAMPIELYIYGLARELENKGVTREQIQRNVMAAQINGGSYGGPYRGFDIFITNSIKQPSGDDVGWDIVAASNSAVAAPMRPIRSYVTLPENAPAEKHIFRHVCDYGRGLVNSELLVLGKIGSGAVLA